MAKKEERKIEKIISKKAFEIAYALCRLAQILKNENFSQNFESQALKILNFSIQKDFDNLKTSLLNLEYFIHLAVELNILKINLAEILFDEISALNKYIIEAEEEILLSQSEIENILKNGNNKKTKLNKVIKKEFIDEIPKDSAITQNFKNYYPKDSAIIQDTANNLRKDSAIDFGKIKNSAIDVRDSAIDDKDSAIDPNIEIDLALKEDSAKEQINNVFFEDFSFDDGVSIDTIDTSIAKDPAMNSATNSAMNSAKDSEYSAKILNPTTNSAIDLENSAINSAKDYTNGNNSAIDPAIVDNSAININSTIENPAMNPAITDNSAIENSPVKNPTKEGFLGDGDKDSATISTTEPPILLRDSTINSIPEKAPSAEPSGFKHISEIIKETTTPTPAFSEETEESFSIKKSVFWERISHLDEFKLKDIENIFPDISERTLRYYLSELVSLGFIEKIGTSGRNVIYRVKK
jgi:hypothetical protein